MMRKGRAHGACEASSRREEKAMPVPTVDDEPRSDRCAIRMGPSGSGGAGASAALALLDDGHRDRLRRAALHLPGRRSERGGSAADCIIDVLQLDSDGYFNNTAGGRYPFTSPAAGIWGPKVMIVNEMAERQNYVATFTNTYGEEWLFEYNYRIREGILKGSDVNWQSYRVIGGRTLGLILNNEELQWLREVWAEATSTWSACGAAPAGMPARKIVGRNACSAVRSLAATCRRRLMACRGVLRLSADRSVSTMGS